MMTRTFQSAILTAACCAMSVAVLAQGMPPAAVVIDRVQLRMLAPTINVPGTVVSRFDSRLASELNAKLKWIAEVGTEVEEGDTIARLENITFRLNEMEAQSRVVREQARVTFLQSEKSRLLRLAENNLSAKSQLDRTTSDLAIAESDEAIAKAQLGHAKVAMHVTEIRAPFGANLYVGHDGAGCQVVDRQSHALDRGRALLVLRYRTGVVAHFVVR